MSLRTTRQSVFISYSHRDREWLDRLNVHLRPLVGETALVVWDDTKIPPGSTWKTEIESALANAKVAILLISADFLASDFVARSEIPPLLAAARDDGAVILPLIISASRFSHTPMLAQFQAVNDPSKPLIGLGRSEQEEILVDLSEAVERAMGDQHTTTVNADSGADPEGGVNTVPLIKRMRLRECLDRLGCEKELVFQEEDFIRKWLGRRVTETLWQREGPDVAGYLREIGEPEQVRAKVARFADHIVACCAPTHGRVSTGYVSIKKVSDAYRVLQRELGAARSPAVDEHAADKLVRVHDYLLKTDRLTFLPARLLLDGDLPSRDDEVCYFVGSFTLDVDEAEIARVPGAAEAMVEKETKSMYGVVTNVFENPDPFAYPLLRFVGNLGQFPVTMILSRKYIQFGSSMATFLAHALSGRQLGFQGVGTLKHSEGMCEVHPLSCSETFSER